MIYIVFRNLNVVGISHISFHNRQQAAHFRPGCTLLNASHIGQRYQGAINNDTFAIL